jgi:hypothetical protein
MLKTCFAAILALNGCQTSSGPVPKVDVHLFAGDSKNDGVTRANPGEPVQTIKCSDPAIDDGYWIKIIEFNKIISTYIGSCEKWKDGVELADPNEIWMKVKP